MAMDQQTGQETGLRLPIVLQQGHPIALQTGHPIVLQQELPIVPPTGTSIVPQPGLLRRHVHQHQTFSSLRGGRVEPGVAVTVVVE